MSHSSTQALLYSVTSHNQNDWSGKNLLKRKGGGGSTAEKGKSGREGVCGKESIVRVKLFPFFLPLCFLYFSSSSSSFFFFSFFFFPSL